MKKFSNYQHVEGETMNERDKKEVGSKFWNKGKWDNFVLPFLPKDCSGMTLVDMGCNAGLFLKLAEDKGFSRVVGVDADNKAIKIAQRYKERVGGKYKLHHKLMEAVLYKLPVADYTILANAHYYFPIDDWLIYLDELKAKTRYCIIVTAKKREKICKAASDTEGIRSYFKDWKEVGIIDNVSMEGDSFPRNQWSFCFKSPLIERVSIDSLDCGNHVQDGYYEALDKGIHIKKTRYYKILRNYRKNWSKEMLMRYMESKAKTFKSVKENGARRPIIINSRKRIVDGNHKYSMLKHLGNKDVLIRKVL